MRIFGRITGLALLLGGHIILPFYINIKLVEKGYSLSFRIILVLVLLALGFWNVVREIRKIIREERRGK